MDPATEGGHVIAAENWDYSKMLSDCVVITHVYQDEKPDFVMVAEAETLSDAYVRGSHMPCSVANLIAAHKDGVAIGFEMDSETVDVMRMLRDHAGHPYSICNHENMFEKYYI